MCEPMDSYLFYELSFMIVTFSTDWDLRYVVRVDDVW